MGTKTKNATVVGETLAERGTIVTRQNNLRIPQVISVFVISILCSFLLASCSGGGLLSSSSSSTSPFVGSWQGTATTSSLSSDGLIYRFAGTVTINSDGTWTFAYNQIGHYRDVSYGNGTFGGTWEKFGSNSIKLKESNRNIIHYAFITDDHKKFDWADEVTENKTGSGYTYEGEGSFQKTTTSSSK